jgi:hypothetical protein
MYKNNNNKKGKNVVFFQKGLCGYKIKNNNTIIVVKGTLPPSWEGRSATF